MAIGVPVFAVIYAGIKALVNQQLVKRGFSTNTKDYMFLSEIKENHLIEKPPPKQKERKGIKKETESKEFEKTEIK